MADEAAAPAANPVSTPVAPPTGNVSADDAVAFLRERRNGPQTREPATPEPPAGAVADQSAGFDLQDDAAAALEQPPGETEDADPAGEPPISPPKSWTKAERDAFASLPREHQQAIAERERERESYYRKGHDEAAARAREASEARAAAEQARQQYEQALPSLLQQFQGQFASEYGDIKTWDDVRRLSVEDPYRYSQYDAAQKQMQALRQETARVQHQQQQEAQANWQRFVTEQDTAFFDKAPEFKDPVKRAKLDAEADEMFRDLGFSEKEMAEFISGRPLQLRDHRVRLLARDALRYRAAQKALKAAQPKPVPPVQRPGTATSRGEVSQSHIRDLSNKLKSTGKVDDAVALLRARRKAS